MNKKIRFTNFIQPICLFYSTFNEADVKGTVVGYGKGESLSTHEITPKHYESTSVDFVKCLYAGEPYHLLVSERTFCSKGNDAIACKGD
jgi:hypothetical protein